MENLVVGLAQNGNGFCVCLRVFKFDFDNVPAAFELKDGHASRTESTVLQKNDEWRSHLFRATRGKTVRRSLMGIWIFRKQTIV
jgi:hypothetical protein